MQTDATHGSQATVLATTIVGTVSCGNTSEFGTFIGTNLFKSPGQSQITNLFCCIRILSCFDVEMLRDPLLQSFHVSLSTGGSPKRHSNNGLVGAGSLASLGLLLGSTVLNVPVPQLLQHVVARQGRYRQQTDGAFFVTGEAICGCYVSVAVVVYVAAGSMGLFRAEPHQQCCRPEQCSRGSKLIVSVLEPCPDGQEHVDFVLRTSSSLSARAESSSVAMSTGSSPPQVHDVISCRTKVCSCLSKLVDAH